MTQYAITFPARTMVLTQEEFQQAGVDANAVVEEMKAAGVYVAAGGIDPEAPVDLVAADGTTTAGPYEDTAGFNGGLTNRMLARALDELEEAEVAPDAVTVVPVPGAFELPLAAMALAKTRRFACIVALGCVIRGDTPHFDYVASEAASGLQLAAIETGVPVSFGVLTLDRPDQAAPRLEKGAEAVRTALEMADLFANLRAAAAR